MIDKTLVLVALIWAAHAEEKGGKNKDGTLKFQPFTIPWPSDVKYTPTRRGTDWCKVDNRIFGEEGKPLNGTFMQALAGYNISVLIMLTSPEDGPDWLKHDTVSGVIDGGYIPLVMDEVSRRTGLRWRSSVAVVNPPNSKYKETYDSWLHWGALNYDIIAGAYAVTIERRLQGLRFGFPFLDSSPELVSVMKVKSVTWYEQFFSWSRPFTAELWLTILLFIVFTSLVYWELEEHQPEGDFKKERFAKALHINSGWEEQSWEHVEKIYHSLILTMLSFTGGGAFMPVSKFGKFFVFAWTFCVLLLVSSYVANLASFMIISSTREASINGLHDAIKRGVPVCVYKGGAFDSFLRDRYPMLPLVYPDKWGYFNIRQKKCGAMVKDAFYFRIDKGRKEHNPNCDLDVVGRPIVRVSSAFVGGHNHRCTSLVMEVLDAAMQSMYIDGWFDHFEEKFVKNEADQNCDENVEDDKTSDAAPLGLSHTYGIFALNFVVAIFCVIGHKLLLSWRKATGRNTIGRTKSEMPDGDRSEKTQFLAVNDGAIGNQYSDRTESSTNTDRTWV